MGGRGRGGREGKRRIGKRGLGKGRKERETGKEGGMERRRDVL